MVAKHYRRVSETPCFPGEYSREIGNDYGERKLIRRSVFNTAGSLGYSRSLTLTVLLVLPKVPKLPTNGITAKLL